tara:strand:+ start:216 stop:806 length:591 start_codon:yes stop_codon:yes gene_type:complete
MSVIAADTIKTRVVGAAVTTTGGLNVGGACTATSFVGPLTGAVTGNADTATTLATARDIGGVSFNGSASINLPGVNQSGTQNTSGTAANLSGTPDITIRNVTGVAATFTGVLTYEDVTNVDSVGIVTARGGIELGAAGVGGTMTAVGNAEFAGIVTATTGSYSGTVTAAQFVGGGSGLTGLNIPAGFTELDAALFN